MFTVCPRCTLTLAVTAEDLRAGQGYVRCGRCLNVFNALLSLTEGSPGADPQSFSQANPASSSQITRALETTPPPASTVPEPPSLAAPDATFDPAAVTDEHEILEPDADEAISVAEIIDPLREPQGGSHPQLPTEVSGDGAFENESSLADGTGTFETIVLEGDAITQTEEFAPQESVDDEIAALARRLQARSDEASNEDDTDLDATIRRIGLGQGDSERRSAAVDADELLDVEHAVGAQSAEAEAVFEADPRAPQSIHHRRAWVAGCFLLGTLLILQAINHWRDALASVPSLNAPMTRLYKSLGVPLDPHWDLNAYDIRQQGAVADPGDSHIIRVRLSVANRAARPQPVPLLRLTLLDRYGKRIAARDLAPADYWPRGQTPRSFLAHDERIDSEVAVRDQGPDSASFELDVCLRNLHDVIRCAGDTTSPEPGST
ncbi:MAG TPA: DUF3426 domain-containing protein [Steroidobacteraceae bacterium]|nr:DUF3426 domain-containing protein [Steroidobacteraceae bacterium]